MTTGRGGRRRLTASEIELWIAVAGSVRPLQGSRLPSLPPPPPAPVPLPTPPPGGAKERAAPFLPPYSPAAQQARPAGQPPLAPFEKRYRQKVTRGRIEIDGAIDLHGLTQPEAHAALNGFLRRSWSDGARLVLVVTGKGRALAEPGRESGVLRRAVPQWLRAEALRPIVMGFEEAGLSHGGLGALYIKLRRREA